MICSAGTADPRSQRRRRRHLPAASLRLRVPLPKREIYQRTHLQEVQTHLPARRPDSSRAAPAPPLLRRHRDQALQEALRQAARRHQDLQAASLAGHRPRRNPAAAPALPRQETQGAARPVLPRPEMHDALRHPLPGPEAPERPDPFT